MKVGSVPHYFSDFYDEFCIFTMQGLQGPWRQLMSLFLSR